MASFYQSLKKNLKKSSVNMTIKSKITKQTLKALEKLTKTKLTLGKLIWSIRQSDEISQVDFAEKLNISRQHLCDIEHGRKSVSPKLASDYAKILGYSTEQFIRLALQDIVDRDGLRVTIHVEQNNKNRRNHFKNLAA